nr:class I SAM-dependent methyltransferase [Acidimicrobiales bacterium]
LAALEDTSLWFRGRNLLITRVLETHTHTTEILEVGAGNGTVSAHLANEGLDVIAIEPSIEGARNAHAKGVPVSIAALLEKLQLPDRSVPCVGLFDVIEHLADESKLLTEVHRVLEPGGTCVVTVPAFPSLWSQADEHAGHFRRYRRRELDRTLGNAGLQRRFSSYCFGAAVLPLACLRVYPYRRGRRLDKEAMERSLDRELAGQGALTTRLGLAETRLEAAWLHRWPLPFGTSIIAVYEKST